MRIVISGPRQFYTVASVLLQARHVRLSQNLYSYSFTVTAINLGSIDNLICADLVIIGFAGGQTIVVGTCHGNALDVGIVASVFASPQFISISVIYLVPGDEYGVRSVLFQNSNHGSADERQPLLVAELTVNDRLCAVIISADLIIIGLTIDQSSILNCSARSRSQQFIMLIVIYTAPYFIAFCAGHIGPGDFCGRRICLNHRLQPGFGHRQNCDRHSIGIGTVFIFAAVSYDISTDLIEISAANLQVIIACGRTGDRLHQGIFAIFRSRTPHFIFIRCANAGPADQSGVCGAL